MVGNTIRDSGTEFLAEFQWCKWSQDTTLWKESDWHGIDFLRASYDEEDADTSTTVRPISVEREVEGSDVDEFEEDSEVEKGGEDAERFEAEEEGEFIRKINDPRLPSSEEVERHRTGGHVEYRDWCETCVMARGRDMPHYRDKGGPRVLPEYSWDYCFPGDEFGHKWTVLVGRERDTKMIMATTVPNKGGIGRFASDKCCEVMEENGDKVNKVIVKTDQEPSIEYLIKDLVRRREDGRTIVEEAPLESKGSNGIVERTVQEVEGILRSIYLGLQERLGRKVSTRERIVAFIPDYAAYLVNRLKKGEDGRVAYERCKGKKPTIMGVEFGEKLLFKKRKGQKMEKMNERWQRGIFVGIGGGVMN